MTNLYTHQDSNVAKTWLLMAVFLAVVVGIGYFISVYYNSPEILVIAVVFSLVMNVMSYYNSDKIVLKMYGAHQITRESHRTLWNTVENLAITAGLPMPKVFLIPDDAPNAFATGRDKEHAVVAVTTGLLAMMDQNELEGVVAHELAHIGNRDILLMSVVVVLVGFVSLLADFFLRRMFFGGRDSDSRGGGVLALVGVVLVVLSPIFVSMIQLAVSRKREFLADASAGLLTRYPEGLASALEKLGSYKGAMRKANKATAHLFISNPFGEKKKKVSKLFMTHPPIEERVARLRGVR